MANLPDDHEFVEATAAIFWIACRKLLTAAQFRDGGVTDQERPLVDAAEKLFFKLAANKKITVFGTKGLFSAALPPELSDGVAIPSEEFRDDAEIDVRTNALGPCEDFAFEQHFVSRSRTVWHHLRVEFGAIKHKRVGPASGGPSRRGLSAADVAEAQLALPEPQFLKLSEAVRRVAASCGVSESHARARLDRAFRERELVPVSTDGNTPDTWESAEIDWDTSTISCSSPLGDGSHTRTVQTNMRVSRSHLDEWMAQARSNSMKREATARLFAAPFWSVQTVLAWIAFRDPARLGASWMAAILYDTSPAAKALKDRQPRQALLRALHYDNLRAIRDGREMRREEWASADGCRWPDVRFRREDVLALWPAFSADAGDHLTFKEIARRWSKLSGDPEESMLGGLVSAFWRGEFEREDGALVFALQPPTGPPSPRDEPLKDLPGQYASSSMFGDAVVKVGDDGEHYLTAERRAARMNRRDVANVLGGMSDYVPWPWDETDAGLLAYASVPYADWPTTMRSAHFEEWRLYRVDFAAWYHRAAIWPKPSLESMWPGPPIAAPEVVPAIGANTPQPTHDAPASRPAPEAAIHAAITAAYDEAERAKMKPPNVKELPAVVRSLLAKKGFTASGHQIQRLAAAPRHAQRRRKPGKTMASEHSRARP